MLCLSCLSYCGRGNKVSESHSLRANPPLSIPLTKLDVFSQPPRMYGETRYLGDCSLKNKHRWCKSELVLDKESGKWHNPWRTSIWQGNWPYCFIYEEYSKVAL